MRIPSRLRAIDIKIIAYLRKHGRAPLSRVAQETALPTSTVHDRLKIISAKLVKSHITNVNFSLLGYSLRCYVVMKVHNTERQGLKEFLEKHPNVNMLLQINNGYDFLIETYYPEIAEFEEFLLKLQSVFRIKHCQPFYVIDELSSEKFCSNQETLHLLNLRLL